MAHVAGLERALIDDEDEHPAEAGPVVRADRPGTVEACDRPAVVSTYSALTTRRGWPATVTVKSAAVRPRIGWPCRSTTPTSTVTSSTPLLNVGIGCCGGAGCCAQLGRAPEREGHAQLPHRPSSPSTVFMAYLSACCGLPARYPCRARMS